MSIATAGESRYEDLLALCSTISTIALSVIAAIYTLRQNRHHKSQALRDRIGQAANLVDFKFALRFFGNHIAFESKDGVIKERSIGLNDWNEILNPRKLHLDTKWRLTVRTELKLFFESLRPCIHFDLKYYDAPVTNTIYDPNVMQLRLALETFAAFYSPASDGSQSWSPAASSPEMKEYLLKEYQNRWNVGEGEKGDRFEADLFRALLHKFVPRLAEEERAKEMEMETEDTSEKAAGLAMT
jgi:hypothetical protein